MRAPAALGEMKRRREAGAKKSEEFVLETQRPCVGEKYLYPYVGANLVECCCYLGTWAVSF